MPLTVRVGCDRQLSATNFSSLLVSVGWRMHDFGSNCSTEKSLWTSFLRCVCSAQRVLQTSRVMSMPWIGAAVDAVGRDDQLQVRIYVAGESTIGCRFSSGTRETKNGLASLFFENSGLPSHLANCFTNQFFRTVGHTAKRSSSCFENLVHNSS